MTVMVREAKGSQLQIRISARQKRKLRQRARAAGMTVSEWLLALAFPSQRDEFERLVRALELEEPRSSPLAALNDWLEQLDADEFEQTVREPVIAKLSKLDAALAAAMIEHAAWRKGAHLPGWVLATPAVSEPFFASGLKSLRLHLLSSSPPAFRRRNLFVDTTVGGRV
jgi:hypothetical protein